MEGEEDSRPQQSLSSLFPLCAPSTSNIVPSATAGPSWLCNTSFTANVSAVATPAAVTVEAEGSSEEEDVSRSIPQQASYNLVASPDATSFHTSSESDWQSKRKERKRKHKRKRKEKDGSKEERTRKSGVRLWAGSDSKKDIYFDIHGDQDNLAFGSLYRMDVPRYKNHNLVDLSEPQYGSRRYSFLDEEGDDNFLDSKLSDGVRYFSAKYFVLEGDKNFKHVKITKKIQSRFFTDFIPLNDQQSSYEDSSVPEESWEDEVLHRTREFNKTTRESPHDEEAWIAFAEFQDKVASRQPQKAARLQTLEKKISILEKAVELNPGSEALLLRLLKTYEKRDSGEALIARWEKILVTNYGNYRLWKEFLLVCQGEFSRFKVSDIRKRYAHAIQALSSAHSRICRQGNQSDKLVQNDLVQLELGLVDIFISLCRFEWQTGFQEVATGLCQAEIEYSLLCPSLDLSIQSKLRLFQHFWESGCARVGEEGAVGWSTWIEEEEHRQDTREDSTEETEVGGWSGWFDPNLKNVETNLENGMSAEPALGEGITEDNLESDSPQEDVDIEVLLKKLGVNVDAEPQSEIKDSATWNRWSQEETLRDGQQWMPVRESLDNTDSDQLSRTILFEDISDYLFSLQSEEARFCLISRIVEFYGGQISQWACTNNTSWISNIPSLDVLPDCVLEHLYDAFETVKTEKNHAVEVIMGDLRDTTRISIMKFLRNILLLVFKVFPRNYKLEEALLLCEESITSQMTTSCSVAPSQGLAKHLLKSDRQDLLLSGLYARREAANGNFDRARKVFDMTLLLMNDLPLDVQQKATLLFLWYAEMELKSGRSEHPSLRAIHILSCLGASVAYSTFNGQVSSLQLLKARNGFQDQIKSLWSEWCRGCITDHSVAVVCSASLFELLTVGWKSAIQVYEEAFSMALPERRSQSLQFEYLSVSYIDLLKKNAKEIKFSVLWSKILQQLQSYPHNPTILSSIVEVGRKYSVPQKIRFLLDRYYQRNPSIHIFLLALIFELERSSSPHRVRGLFERALTNDMLQKSVILWRSYLAFEFRVANNASAARRIFFRAIHACPWSKKLWLDGFQQLNSSLTANELTDLHDVMHDKELNLRTDIYEILLQDEVET